MGSPRLAVPAALVGSWVAMGGDAAISITFDEAGSYVYAGVLEGGSMVFNVTANGWAAVHGNVLTLQPIEGVESLRDSSAPQSNYDKPISTKRQTFQIVLADDTLQLTDAAGATITYERQ